MSHPTPNALVLDGSQVKLRLMAARSETREFVHVDWLRFTVLRRNAPLPSADALFPSDRDYFALNDSERQELEIQRSERRVASALAGCDDGTLIAAIEAAELGRTVAAALGSEFALSPEPAKGHDFYKYRLPILRGETECGWIGFLASGEKRGPQQNNTLHVNLFGVACTFAAPGWRQRMQTVIDDTSAKITRVDLALDYFDGLPGGLAGVADQYMSGAMDVRGARPAVNQVGDWCNGRSRSFYFGSKQAGKQTNVYEKGDQLFGVESGNPWVRVELRYGNKLRVIPSDVLARPGDYFAGASDWHRACLDTFAKSVPVAIKQEKRLTDSTVDAEVSRNVRWAVRTAGATIGAAFRFLPDAAFLDLFEPKKLPARLQKFSASEIASAFSRVCRSFNAGSLGPVPCAT